MGTGLDDARAVADAVLYEGYLLYPYRSTSGKNRLRWQFGVLGPPGAAAAGLGEEPALRCEVPVRAGPGCAVRLRLRFLQLRARDVENPGGVRVERLDAGGESWLSWVEATEHELAFGPYEPAPGLDAVEPVRVPGGEEVEPLPGAAAGRVVRRRAALQALVRVRARELAGDLLRLRVEVTNTGVPAVDRDDAARRSLTGTHLLLSVSGGAFVSVIDPPADARAAAAACTQSRCWPVLASGRDGEQEGEVVLGAPIILYDHPRVAPQSPGDLFDATEIDEILTLRVLTLTEREKAEARRTDPRAAALIDRCESLTPQELQRLHGVLRDPRAGTSTRTGDDWWAAQAAAPVSPETDSVTVAGVRLSGGSLVRLRPVRRADAQDMFLAGRRARVSAVHTDLDGATHVAVTLLDDPAAELHDWYGRHLYFAPDELEPAEPETS